MRRLKSKLTFASILGSISVVRWNEDRTTSHIIMLDLFEFIKPGKNMQARIITQKGLTGS